MSEESTLPEQQIAELLSPFSGEIELSPLVLEQISGYLDLLVRWNARLSLTSIRSPEEMVRRHLGESLFAATVLREKMAPGAELLDFGSGAGFPGLPLQIVLPQVKVTVAESQARKVAFLREVVRTLGLSSEVWPRRVEDMPVERRFDVVTMRAVDKMGQMQGLAEARVRPGGRLALLVGGKKEELDGDLWAIPDSERRWLALRSVPRGTQP